MTFCLNSFFPPYFCFFFFVFCFFFVLLSDVNAENGMSHAFSTSQRNDRFGGSRYYDFVPRDFILKFVSEKEKSCSFVFRLDYKVKPVVISKNLLAIRMSHCRGSSGDCDVGSSLFMFTCHLTPFALESRDIHLHRLVARTTWQPTTFYSSYVCACVDASNLH